MVKIMVGKPYSLMKWDDLGGKPHSFRSYTHIIFSLIEILMNQGFIGASWHIKPPDLQTPPKTYFGRFLKGFLLLLQKYHASQTAHLFHPLIFVQEKNLHQFSYFGWFAKISTNRIVRSLYENSPALL